MKNYCSFACSEIGGRTLYRVLVGDTGGETENSLLNETVPNWVISNIADNCTSKFTKVQFYLKPHPSVPSNLLKQDRLKKVSGNVVSVGFIHYNIVTFVFKVHYRNYYVLNQ